MFFWDKAARIKYRRPTKSNVYCEFVFTAEEIHKIKVDVSESGEIDILKLQTSLPKIAPLLPS